MRNLFITCVLCWQLFVFVVPSTIAYDVYDDSVIQIDSYVPSHIPTKQGKSLGPVLTAKSAIAIDMNSGHILYAKNIYERLPIASITKVITVLVALEHDQTGTGTLIVPREAAQVIPSKIYLQSGDTLTVVQLVFASIIASANDAAMTLGTMYYDFIERMNNKAQEIGLEDTHFSNVVGWDEPGNYSTTYDISQFISYAMKNPIINTALKTREKTLISLKNNIYIAKSTNKLFNTFLDEVGGKTGTTDEAGPSLVNIARTSQGKPVMVVLLNSQDRFFEAKLLHYWVEKNYSWK